MKSILWLLLFFPFSSFAQAVYPDLEAWAQAPPSGWVVHCNETLDFNDNINSQFWNPSNSVSKPCPGTPLDAFGKSWSTVPINTVKAPSGASVQRILRSDQSMNGGSVQAVVEGQRFPFTTGRFASRHYTWYSDDAEGIDPANGPLQADARKLVEMQFDVSEWGVNQAQGADWKSGPQGMWDLFFSAPGVRIKPGKASCDMRELPIVGGRHLSLQDCKGYGCRVEQAMTWDGTLFSIEYKITKINSDGTDGEIHESRKSCEPPFVPTKFRGVFINTFADGPNGGKTGARFLSLWLTAHTRDTTLGRWIGPAKEMQNPSAGANKLSKPGTPRVGS